MGLFDFFRTKKEELKRNNSNDSSAGATGYSTAHDAREDTTDTDLSTESGSFDSSASSDGGGCGDGGGV